VDESWNFLSALRFENSVPLFHANHKIISLISFLRPKPRVRAMEIALFLFPKIGKLVRMPNDDSLDDLPADRTARGRQFPATLWELIARAREGGEPRRVALDELCKLYWYPIYAFLRREGYGREESEDFTQGFFVKVLGDETFEAANEQKGRLRTFLLSALKRHMADCKRRDVAQKRGSGRVVSLEAQQAEERYAAEPVDGLDPETIYLRGWCRQILDLARERLREPFTRTGQVSLFETLSGFLDVGDTQTPYSQLAAQTGLTEVALRLHVFRLRQKHRAFLKEEVAQTVSTPEELDSELKWFGSMMAV
jgi:DNA-directed RNA polymerase specialized sigma24 family protein